MGQKFDKFLLLMWKNWILQYRRPMQTVVEILAPVLFSILLVVIRSLVDPDSFPTKTYEPFLPVPLSNSTSLALNIPAPSIPPSKAFQSLFPTIQLVYTPKSNQAIDEIMVQVSKLLPIECMGFDTPKQMEEYFLANNSTFAGLQFPSSIRGLKDIPDDLEVTIRFPGELRFSTSIFGRNSWHTNIMYPVYQVPGPRSPDNDTGASPGYFIEGFLTVQTIFTYLLTYRNESIDSIEQIIALKPPLIQMQRFPYGPWTDDPLLQALETFVGIVIMLSFVYTCISTVRVITSEKEKQLKEAMKIMGLPNWLHWTAWFVKTFVFLFVSVVLIIILLKVSWYPTTSFSVFTYADPSVMLVFLLLYMCATITFCFAISVFFSKANTASTVAGLLWFFSYSPYLFLQNQYDQLSLATKLTASLGSNSAMAYGFQLMLMYEGTNEGMNWKNVFTPITPDDSLTLGYIMFMLILDSIIYLFVAIYVEAIFPGEYGVPLPWYFPFTYSYWCGRPRYIGVTNLDDDISVNESEYFEAEPATLKAGIQIKHLRKVFGKKAAVRNLSLNMYDNQITVLLGHNGAGKTTTMSMLTGMLPPTGGTAYVNGHDIRTEMEAVRASLGLCPQHNILFDDLTVKEHLYFFSKLKGLKNEEIEVEVKNYIELLELEPKANSKSSTLSGGMKRKLCVGMSLCGNSKVVMLDEPTAGMDPAARRALWDLLQKQKEGRSILLSTHFMDEADLLGDRIAIMAGGELQCCGSSFFLKKKYGAGYHLILDIAPECKSNKVTELLQNHIPNITIQSSIGSELTYLLREDQSSHFEVMLSDLENNSDELNIRSYGVSLTTLEEVFMKVGADHGQEEAYNLNVSHESRGFSAFLQKIRAKFNKSASPPVSNDLKLNINVFERYTGRKLIANQFKAMFLKRSVAIARSLTLQFIQNLLPVAFLIIAIVVTRNASRSGDLPKLPITLNSYEDTVTVLSKTTNSYTDSYIQNLAQRKYEHVDDIESMMINLTTMEASTANKYYVAGASFDEFKTPAIGTVERITAWFNNNPYHTPPLALGLALNAMYNKLTGKRIKFANHPLPFTTDTKIKQLLQGNSMGFQLAFNIGFSMAFVSSFYILFYVRERVCKSKHLQFVSGVKVYVFWITSFICDLLTFLITIICLIITLVAFQEDGFKTSSDLARIFFLLCLFAISFIPMMYAASYFFEVPSTGFTRMTLFSVFAGVAAYLVVQVLKTPSIELEYVADALHWAFLLFPHYSLATGIQDQYLTYSFNKICDVVVEECVNFGRGDETSCWAQACGLSALRGVCCKRSPEYFKWESPGIGRNIVYSILVGMTLFSIIIAIEYKITRLLQRKLADKMVATVPEEDSDVSEEKERIRNTPLAVLRNDYTLIMKDVTKYYGNFLAVNGICLGIKQFECFGLLGINGAGKTTTFKMMTGDIKMTNGDAWVQNASINSEIKEVQKLIGYCPQFDALLDDLTAEETLVMFALLRGIPYDECEYIARKLAIDFDFTRHLHKQIKKLSGGNKRKVSTAISLIGDPPVIYLDEPTTGMDPATKRHLWNAICKVRDSGKCVVLTSHSMEECEALCTRLAIMVNGNFKCLGSTQHLKNKFAQGYTLTIKMLKNDDDTSLIEAFINRKFPNSLLRERHQELLTYYIADKSIPWSQMFGILESSKRELNIEDYSLGQSSLEQVFLLFTKLQR